MSDYFTTRELAAFLRIKERKVYDLVAKNALPTRRVTGKILFPKKEIDDWLVASARSPALAAPSPMSAAPPRVMAGGHDPLLEWALRESRCGIAALLDGALDGLAHFKAQTCLAAGLHIPAKNLAEWNVEAVRATFAYDPVVLIEWAKRERGLMYRASARPISKLADVRKLRFQCRQPEAGSELILTTLLEKEGLRKTDLKLAGAVERSETDLGAAIAAGRADVGLGIEAVAKQHGLAFTPLVTERFDLLVSRRDFFQPPFQMLLRFCAGRRFRDRAKAMGGYHCDGIGTVHFNGP